MSETFDVDEREILAWLDGRLSAPPVRAALDATVQRVGVRLSGDPASIMAFEPVPLSIYGEPLPGGIQSSWVFVLRAGAVTGAERHPSSRQRMASYRGAGDLQTRPGEVWLSHRLASGQSAPLEHRWVSIPENVWHQAVVPGEDWVVVSFHTVPAEGLIEERPDPVDPRRSRRRRYL